MLEVQHILVDHCNYASLCNTRGVYAFLDAVAKSIGARVEAGPYGTTQHKRENRSATALWVLAFRDEGFLAFQTALDERAFSLVIAFTRAVTEEELMPVMKQYWGEQDSLGETVLSDPLLSASTPS